MSTVEGLCDEKKRFILWSSYRKDNTSKIKGRECCKDERIRKDLSAGKLQPANGVTFNSVSRVKRQGCGELIVIFFR
jgi:hypothetical protein